jgi:hypothetical protein
MKNTGGPAFPVRLPIVGAIHKCDEPVPTEIHAGLTLRDYFAAKAMQALFAGAVTEGLTMDQDIECDKLAMVAYVMADAMLEARK